MAVEVRLVSDKSQDVIEKITSQIPSEATLGEMFSPAFMSQNTPFASLEEMVAASGLDGESITSIGDLDTDQMTNLLKSQTRFSSFEEIFQAAGQAWVTAQASK